MKKELILILSIVIMLTTIYGISYFLSSQVNPMNYPTYGKIIFIMCILLGFKEILEDDESYF